VDFGVEGWLVPGVAVAMNLAGCVIYNLMTWRAHRRLKQLVSSPHYWCARMGHEFEHAMITLENHQPPNFEWTHMHKFTCKNCGFVESLNQRQKIFCPGVSEIKSLWVGQEEEE